MGNGIVGQLGVWLVNKKTAFCKDTDEKFGVWLAENMPL